MNIPQFVIRSPDGQKFGLRCFWLLCIKLLRTFLYKSFCGHVFSFILDKNLGVKLLGHRVKYIVKLV